MKIGYNKKFSSEIKYQDGNVYLESDENPIAIDIKYKGNIMAESLLPQGFFMSGGGDRILIVRISNQETPKLLFKYFGSFQIIYAKVYGKDSSSISTLSTNLNDWVHMDGEWSKSGSNWEEYSDGYAYFPKPEETNLSTSKLDKVWNTIKKSGSIILSPNIGQLDGVYLKGVKYDGNVKYDSRGIFMTDDKKPLDLKANKKAIISRLKKRRK